MEADETHSARISTTSSPLCLSSETKSSGELLGPFSDGLCSRCQHLKIHVRDLGERSDPVFGVPYSLEDNLPELSVLSLPARDGCKFCELLRSIIVEFVSHNQHHQWLGNSCLSAWLPSYKRSHSGSLSYLELIVKFRESLHLEESVECTIYFEVELPAGNGSNRLNIARTHLEPHSLSEKNVAKFKSWLHQCHTEHEDCQQDRTGKKLPTRLLAVGGEPLNELPRIIVCKDDPAVTDCEETPYIALSHCWGKGIMPMKTERHSLSDRMNCIPLETMPRTYHDAVVLTRSLGISYLWIDSLCIVQDDKDEWKEESSSMVQVYQNAYMTICALVTSCNDGLFRGSRAPGLRVPFNSQMKEDVNDDYFIRYAVATTSHKSYHQDIYKAIKLCDDVKGSSWLSRGWTFQEELFSTRRLLCSERLIYLDCNMASCSENSILFEAVSKSLPSRLRNNHADLFSTWYDLISSYSGRSLTYEQDRLPAISSLAALFAKGTENKYIAGLWKNDLPYGLLWHRSDDQRDRPNLSDLIKRHKCRPQFIGPSWSWACEGRSSNWLSRAEEYIVECKVLKAWSDTDNINSFGSITSAHLVLEGKLFSVSHISLRESHDGYFLAATSGVTLGEWYLDFDPTKEDFFDWMREWENNTNNLAKMFFLTKHYEFFFPVHSGLLIYPTACPNEYLRIGIFEKRRWLDGEDDFLSDFLSTVTDSLEDAPYCEITLI